MVECSGDTRISDCKQQLESLKSTYVSSYTSYMEEIARLRSLISRQQAINMAGITASGKCEE